MTDTLEKEPVEEKDDLTLADDIEAAFKALDEKDETDEPEVDVDDTGDGDSGKDDAEDDSDDSESDEDSGGDGETDEGDDERAEDSDEKLDPPSHWASEDKELFSGQPKEVQEWLLNRHKSMEADYTRKTQELAETRRYKEQVDGLLNPYRQQFAMQGMDDVGAIRYLVSWKQYLDTNPQQAIQALARDYGVSFDQTQPDEDVDPAIAALNREINGMKAQEAQRAQQAQLAQQQALTQQVDAFRNTKDETGNPKYPHFDTVRADMAVLIQGGKAQGLEDAYESAVRLHPDIFDASLREKIAKEQAGKSEEAKRKAETEKKAKAAKAKKAASGVKSGSASVQKDAPKTLRDEILAAMGE